MAKIRALRKCPLFKGLSYRDLAILAPHLEEVSFELGEKVSEEGAPSQGLILISQGRVKLTHSALGEDHAELGPEDFFGELALANGGEHPRFVEAVALEDTIALKLEPSAFSKLMKEAPNVAGRISQGILDSATQKIASTRDLLREALRSNGSK